MLTPDEKRITEQINNDDNLYKCEECKKEFKGSEMEVESLPENFHIHGLGLAQRVPKCPHCGTLSFFGFEDITDA